MCDVSEITDPHTSMCHCCYNAGRPFSLSCMSAMAPPVKSLSTCTVSRWSCSDSRTNSCWVSASCCTDSDRSSRERDTVSSRMLVACCSWRLSDALCSMLSLVLCEDWPGDGNAAADAGSPVDVWGCACFWVLLLAWWSSFGFAVWVEGSISSLCSSSESPNAFSVSEKNKTHQHFLSTNINQKSNFLTAHLLLEAPHIAHQKMAVMSPLQH